MKTNLSSFAKTLAKRQVLARRSTYGLVAILGTMVLGPGVVPALANQTSNRSAIGDTTVFASVPAPGHPFGVAVDKNRVYISTSAGDFFTAPGSAPALSSGGLDATEPLDPVTGEP